MLSDDIINHVHGLKLFSTVAVNLNQKVWNPSHLRILGVELLEGGRGLLVLTLLSLGGYII